MNWIENRSPETPLLSCTNIVAKFMNGQIYEGTVEEFEWKAIDYYMIVDPVKFQPTEEVEEEVELTTYYVHVMERWAQTYQVDAVDPADAIKLVSYGNAMVCDSMFEMRDTMNIETWEVEEV